MAGYPSNLAKKFSPTEQFPQHILPLLPLYNARWWGYESLTVIVLVADDTGRTKQFEYYCQEALYIKIMFYLLTLTNVTNVVVVILFNGDHVSSSH